MQRMGQIRVYMLPTSRGGKHSSCQGASLRAGGMHPVLHRWSFFLSLFFSLSFPGGMGSTLHLQKQVVFAPDL